MQSKLFKKLLYIVPFMLIGCSDPSTAKPNVVISPSPSVVTSNNSDTKVNNINLTNIEKGKAANVLIWQVTSPDGKNKSYIMGTIHVPFDSKYTLPVKVTNALKSSTNFYMEADTSNIGLDPSILAGSFNLEQKLENEFEPAVWAKLVDRLKAIPGMSSEILNFLEPWLLKSLLSTPITPEMTSPEALNIMDNLIKTEAQNQKVKINFLEGIADQLNALKNSKTREGHIADIKAILTKEVNYSSDITQGVIDSYNKGDIKSFLELDKAQQTVDQTEYKVLLTDRENNWYKKLNFATDKLFVAVGALHVIRENGLLDNLKAKGFKVEIL